MDGEREREMSTAPPEAKIFGILPASSSPSLSLLFLLPFFPADSKGSAEKERHRVEGERESIKRERNRKKRNDEMKVESGWKQWKRRRE